MKALVARKEVMMEVQTISAKHSPVIHLNEMLVWQDRCHLSERLHFLLPKSNIAYKVRIIYDIPFLRSWWWLWTIFHYQWGFYAKME